MEQRSPQVRVLCAPCVYESCIPNNNDPSKGILQGDGPYDLSTNQLGIFDKDTMSACVASVKEHHHHEVRGSEKNERVGSATEDDSAQRSAKEMNTGPY
jgi:hypothetical protein